MTYLGQQDVGLTDLPVGMWYHVLSRVYDVVSPQPTFASRVRVRLIFLLACTGWRENNFGDKMAGAKNRRKRKPLTARYGMSLKTGKIIQSVLIFQVMWTLSYITTFISHVQVLICLFIMSDNIEFIVKHKEFQKWKLPEWIHPWILIRCPHTKDHC